MILLIDNYDSFVYNLARYVSELGFIATVKRNDALSLQDIQQLNPSHIILSPGPCTPNEAGITMAIVQHFGAFIPILGICLGHQAIGQAYGARIIRAIHPRHGKASAITHCGKGIFQAIDNPCTVARYHSLIIDPDSLPDTLEITARCEAGEIMAIQHCSHPVTGVQFHPESILTQDGHRYIKNFLDQIPNAIKGADSSRIASASSTSTDFSKCVT